jgi:hemolysin III
MNYTPMRLCEGKGAPINDNSSDICSEAGTETGSYEIESVPELLPQCSYWAEYIPWYPDGCFGPYRPHCDGYSRRELAADGATHVIGISLGCVGFVMLIVNAEVHQPPLEVKISLWLYGVGLLAMLCFSAVFNGFAWSEHIWALQLCDHIGILLLIACTYTPMMTFACRPWVLAFVWGLALVSMIAKASRSRLDVVAFHVPCFLLTGWSCLLVWQDLIVVFTPWALKLLMLGGTLYTVGLVPWALNKLEFHNALWHIFVVAASSCFLAVLYVEVSQPQNWQAVAKGTCQANLFGV